VGLLCYFVLFVHVSLLLDPPTPGGLWWVCFWFFEWAKSSSIGRASTSCDAELEKFWRKKEGFRMC